MNSNKGGKSVSVHDQTRNIINAFLSNIHSYQQDGIYHELEVKFATTKKHVNKNQFDNVIRKLYSSGFTCDEPTGKYMLRIQNEFVNPKGEQRISNTVRTELNGFHLIQLYCKNENIQKLLDKVDYRDQVVFTEKKFAKRNDENIQNVDVRDFNFRISYNTERSLSPNSGIIKSLIGTWDASKKVFRYLNRFRFRHPDFPIFCDMTTVKNSSRTKTPPHHLRSSYTLQDSKLFEDIEHYEIELELDTERLIKEKTVFDVQKLHDSVRLCIKYVLSGIQNTNYPIPHSEMDSILLEYYKLIHGNNDKPITKINYKDFIGPSSYTLQMENIRKDDDMKVSNIRNAYTVTDKADGERNLIYISSKGKIYMIDSNLSIQFTGSKTDEKQLFSSLIDGEHIHANRRNEYINLFAAFDIYYLNNKNLRKLPFTTMIETIDSETSESGGKKREKSSRLGSLRSLIHSLNSYCIVKDSITSLRLEMKHFEIASGPDSIFKHCASVITRTKNVHYEYNTDGLIFTPIEIPLPTTNHKSTWEHSFKWKPHTFNTIDFLVKIRKNEDDSDVVSQSYLDGKDLSTNNKMMQYKRLILMCGFSKKDHGYINPCEDVLQDVIPSFKNHENSYEPVPFYPTNPYDDSAHQCNVALKYDKNGVLQMFTEENEVIEDNTIVEFRYEMNADAHWKWKPLRVRHDKTYQLRSGMPNYGNAYHVANSNWHSIHNPITEEMISTGQHIPENFADDDVYYKKTSGKSYTKSLRDFHNLVVKRMLILGVSNVGNTLIDFAVGKGGDFPKWIHSKLSFVYGIDVSKDNIENKLDGACARYLNYKKRTKQMPNALFVWGNSGLNIRNGDAIQSDKYKMVNQAIFGRGPKDSSKLGKGVYRQYGKGEDGFNISSCQFAIHYFFESPPLLQEFLRNVASCTKVDGYFIGTCYDGKTIYQKLKDKTKGESMSIFHDDTKLWELKKDFDNDYFDDDSSCIGYAIDVYQESIHQMITEYLVNFDYLTQLMENYGFKIISYEEANEIGLPSGTGMFESLKNQLIKDVRNKTIATEGIGSSLNMTDYEEKISFLNRYFVFKKTRHVDPDDVVIDMSAFNDKMKETDKTKDASKNDNEMKKRQSHSVSIIRKTRKRVVLK